MSSSPLSSSYSSTALLFVEVARTLAKIVQQGRSLDDALSSASYSEEVSRAAVQALTYGSLRRHHCIEFWLSVLLERPADLKHPELRALLTVGLHQLAYSDHPPHAIVHQTVEAARLLQQERATKLVNAILRRFLRERSALEAKTQRHSTAKHSHPQWLVDRMCSNWPGDWERILEANNEQPPLWLRVNKQKNSTAEYLELLKEKGIEALPSEAAPEALRLTTPLDVNALPGFNEGRVSVQDAAAQLAAPLLGAQPGMRVLDACAAPGGKTCHLLELTPQIAELIAVERFPERLNQIEENLRRLDLKAQLIAGDASRPEEWLPQHRREERFQRILLDVPCSATGVIRRHPDIKVLRRPADIEKLAREQARLLRGLWPLLEAGGRLLYASCTVLRAENAGVIAEFLKNEPTASERKIELPLRAARPALTGPGWQILPGEAGMDGFYYACLEKRH